MMELRLRTQQNGGAIVVEVAGEIELHSAPQLRSELHRVCEGENKKCIVVDLSRVSFIDSTGLGVLIGGLKRARENGSLSLVCPQARVRRVFEITGLTTVFPIFDTLQEAVESCTSTVDLASGDAAHEADKIAAEARNAERRSDERRRDKRPEETSHDA